MWKSWIATLCVALIAFATLEVASPAHAADACDQTGVTVMADGGDMANVSAGSAQDETGGPGDQQQQQQRHHCCGAHTSSTPPL
ncbi:MAG TPA: hypothetical protein PLS69_14925, partial [Terricaulis sp.]|nr:hypothetical protein [Terricaulis sp.]